MPRGASSQKLVNERVEPDVDVNIAHNSWSELSFRTFSIHYPNLAESSICCNADLASYFKPAVDTVETSMFLASESWSWIIRCNCQPDN